MTQEILHVRYRFIQELLEEDSDAASAEAIVRIVNHMANNMSYHHIQGADVQLRVLGKNQSASWSGARKKVPVEKGSPIFYWEPFSFWILFVDLTNTYEPRNDT